MTVIECTHSRKQWTKYVSEKLQEALISDSSNREAVMQLSPGLPRFAPTLGSSCRSRVTPTGLRLLRKSNDGFKPERETESRSLPEPEELTRPRWGCNVSTLLPRVAAKRDNPGLCFVTASR